MGTTEIRKRLLKYIETAEDRKVKAIYTIVEDEIESSQLWEDESFVAEMNRRMEELESGKVKGLTWRQVKSKAKKTIQSAKKK